jgi:hypothetical protein
MIRQSDFTRQSIDVHEKLGKVNDLRNKVAGGCSSCEEKEIGCNVHDRTLQPDTSLTD